MHKLSKQKENVSHHDHTARRSTNHTHIQIYMMTLKTFIKLELESKTKIELRYSQYFGAMTRICFVLHGMTLAI